MRLRLPSYELPVKLRPPRARAALFRPYPVQRRLKWPRWREEENRQTPTISPPSQSRSPTRRRPSTRTGSPGVWDRPIC
ncbi:unnamed protein product [Acanthoscelides obtectus]|uniref:Uncharacterized protein n=1 Tax=Acanthoscelides obtectus TaxID=200917 RepID=A0A9P0KGF7_ACAOB|nr:unnamed protein product [Acanthoscelides obtectus]CAK1651080.1 hypothetical protein AOBTE_LOCUS17042 [Acanthoscelides obtectus]